MTVALIVLGVYIGLGAAWVIAVYVMLGRR